jgi:hypothetical protein
VTAAAPGCQALLQRHSQPALAQLPQQAAVRLVQQFVGIHVQGLDYKGRTACYQLLLEVLQVRPLLLLLLLLRRAEASYQYTQTSSSWYEHALVGSSMLGQQEPGTSRSVVVDARSPVRASLARYQELPSNCSQPS